MGRLIVVSNRVPTENPSGGLVVALHDVLMQRGGLWIGADPQICEEGRDRLHDMSDTNPDPAYRKLVFRLNAQERRNYYEGFANSVLWPVCHRRTDLVEMRSEYRADYLAVNMRLARLIARELGPDDQLWVHDYHFLPLASMLRSLGVRNRIGFFLHIPFPNITDLSVLPSPENFAEWLSDFNLVGLQTRGDTARCLEMFRADRRAEFMRDGTIKFDDHVLTLGSFPIGIDVQGVNEAARRGRSDRFGPVAPQDRIIGADRLDYSKGLPQKFRAFGRYLDQRPQIERRPTFTQIAAPSRGEVSAYKQITRELAQISGEVNGAYSELDWTPLRLIHRSVPREDVLGLCRQARVGLVTPLADGMNLVAKEFIAAQNPQDPGVLILSRFAGAAEDMTEAVQVNPHDVDEIAEAISYALAMPHGERLRRYEACAQVVWSTQISTWAERCLTRLAQCTPTLRSHISNHRIAV
ncbi:trehalose-6-phosphate synthase [Rhodobacteraceae bacterium]|nr:trehalose-6-phosphate synthase [Paracoccaceae bacterium]